MIKKAFSQQSFSLAVAFAMVLSSTPAMGVVVTRHDPEILVTGGAIYGTYRWSQQMGLIESQIAAEVGEIADEVARLDQKAASLMKEAQLVEQGMPQVNRETIYTGKYANPSHYNQYAGNSTQMKSSQFRLQPDSAQKLGTAIETYAQKSAQGVEVVVHRVHGTLDSSIRMKPTQLLNGAPGSITSQLVSMAEQQSATMTPGSIVKVEVKYTTLDAPNPDLAKNLRTKAGATRLIHENKMKAQSEKIEKIQRHYDNRMKRLKRLRRMGFVAIAGAVIFGFARASFAQNMVTLAGSCLDGDLLDLQAQGIAIQTGLSEDEVVYHMQDICLE